MLCFEIGCAEKSVDSNVEIYVNQAEGKEVGNNNILGGCPERKEYRKFCPEAEEGWNTRHCGKRNANSKKFCR